MTEPDRLVQAAAEAMSNYYARAAVADLTPSAMNKGAAECALAAAFAALPDITTQVVDESLTLTGCDRLRRRKCCSYHEGMEDGLDVLLAALAREFGEPQMMQSVFPKKEGADTAPWLDTEFGEST